MARYEAIKGAGGFNQPQLANLLTYEGFTLNVYGVGNEPFFSKRTDNSISIVGNKLNKMPDVQVPPEGAINSLFSVSATKKVYFSQGNLQYIGSATTPYWKFADNQWECLGDTGQGSASETANRDLFGWGTSGYEHGATCWQPWSSSNDNSEYNPYNSTSTNLYDGDGDAKGKADWGYNAISNGGNQSQQWRTLTQSEWDYVFNSRSTTSSIRFAKAQVAGVNGVILLPDDWSTSYYSLSSTNQSGAGFTSNVISSSAWTDNLQSHGAVFLPAAGYRDGTSVNSVGSYGYYWSASYNYSSGAYGVYFGDGNLDTDCAYYLSSVYPCASFALPSKYLLTKKEQTRRISAFVMRELFRLPCYDSPTTPTLGL